MSWPEVGLSRVLSAAGGGTWGSDPCADQASFPVLRSTNIRDGRLVLGETALRAVSPSAAGRYRLQPGDLLVTTSSGSAGLIGKNAIFNVQDDRTFLFSNFTWRLRPDPRLIVPQFLYYYMNSARAKDELARTNNTTSGLRNLDTRQYLAQVVPLPSLHEQRLIVEFLDRADALRSLRAKADAKAERILPALFVDMFGDPATNPKNWDMGRLGELGELDRGRSRHRPRNDPTLLGGPHPLIQTGDIANSDGRVRTYTQTYSDAGLAQSKLWPPGTLCITIAANIAKTAILTFSACFPDSVVGFKPGPRVTSEYVQYALGCLRPALEEAAPQSAQKNINLAVLRNLSMPMPPIALQQRFSDCCTRHFEARVYQVESGARLQRLADQLLQRAFRGDLTASWREAHMNELLQEMEQQARVLAQSSNAESPS